MKRQVILRSFGNGTLTYINKFDIDTDVKDWGEEANKKIDSSLVDLRAAVVRDGIEKNLDIRMTIRKKE